MCHPIGAANLNPFLFISGLSCPHYHQASLFLKCLQSTLPGFLKISLLYLVARLALKKHGSNIGLKIKPQSAFNASQALPAANLSAR